MEISKVISQLGELLELIIFPIMPNIIKITPTMKNHFCKPNSSFNFNPSFPNGIITKNMNNEITPMINALSDKLNFTTQISFPYLQIKQIQKEPILDKEKIFIKDPQTLQFLISGSVTSSVSFDVVTYRLFCFLIFSVFVKTQKDFWWLVSSLVVRMQMFLAIPRHNLGVYLMHTIHLMCVSLFF